MLQEGDAMLQRRCVFYINVERFPLVCLSPECFFHQRLGCRTRNISAAERLSRGVRRTFVCVSYVVWISPGTSYVMELFTGRRPWIASNNNGSGLWTIIDI